MTQELEQEIAALAHMTVGELQERYAQVCGERAQSRHKVYLIRRLAWRLQANAEGGISERALRRAAEIVDERDVRVTPPKTGVPIPSVIRPVRISTTDLRLPPVGTMLTRVYRGTTVCVCVLENGFEWGGERYASLTAVAKAITGTHVNGFRFFGLGGVS